MMAGEVVTDQDLLTPEQIRADPMYNEVLFPFGFKWFAGIGFWADREGARVKVSEIATPETVH